MKNVVKNAIDFALDCVGEVNCRPTIKQIAKALNISESEAKQVMQDSEYAKFEKLRDGYTKFMQECKEDFGGFKAFYYLYLAQREAKK